ncbi:MAG: 2OG-Fe(II) oxygenase [Flammeovirgaceae bacterium]
MISIKRNELVIDENQLKKYQEMFAEQHALVFPHFLHPSLESFITSYLTNATYYIKSHINQNNQRLIAKEFALDLDNMLYKVLSFYLNNPKLLEVIKSITGLQEIKSFQGRIYKFEESENTFDNWHSDVRTETEERLVGISINLGNMPYEGGVFKLRNRATQQLYTEVKHDQWGACHFFRISPKLEHMVTNVSGTQARIVYAGWFNNSEITKALVFDK